jgi:Zn ribbon nucleic-acid-binding protein
VESKIKCPVCKSKAQCFDEYVVEDNFHSYLCFKCGYTSNSKFTYGSDELLSSLEASPQLIIELQVADWERDIVWIPSVLNMGERGIIFPEGTYEDWSWKYAKVVDIPEEDREKYNGEEKRLDVESANIYGQHEFLKACKDMGIVEDL